MGSESERRPVMLITGGSRGIGAAIARAAAGQYDVVVNYAADDAAAAAVAADIGGRCAVATVRADVGDEQEVMALFAAVDESFGRLDVLVNNAGLAGGSRGIGAAVARAAAADYDVVVNYAADDVAAAAVAEDIGGRCAVATVRADVGDEQEVMALFAAVDARFGRLDVLVNNAGIAGGYGGVESIDGAMRATRPGGAWRWKSLSMRPGRTALTRMPTGASSFARPTVIVSIAPLDAA